MKIRHQQLALGALLVAAGATPAAGQATPIRELVMYGINNDPPVELIRYSFATDTMYTVGPVRDQFGATPSEMEAFTYIPVGSDKGFYASSNYDAWKRSRLIKINILDASAERYTTDIGYGFVVGMTAYYEAPPVDKWYIYATHRGSVAGVGPNVTNLIRIDPATGVGSLVQPILVASATAYQGLTLGPNGLLYGITNIPRSTLRTIDPLTGAEDVIGLLSTSDRKVEALEWAYGEYDPKITMPGVPATWTTDGCLFAFSDAFDEFMVVNPSTGAYRVYDCAFKVTDAEGLTFFSRRFDPRAPIDQGYD